MQAPDEFLRRLVAESTALKLETPARYEDVLRDIVAARPLPPLAWPSSQKPAATTQPTITHATTPLDFSAPLRDFVPLSSLTNERVEYPEFYDVFTDASVVGVGGSGTVYKARMAPHLPVHIPATISREKFYAVKVQDASINEARMNLWIAQIPEALIPNIVRQFFWLRLQNKSMVLFATIMEYVEDGAAGADITKILTRMAMSRNFAGLRWYIASGIAQVFAGLCQLGAAGIKHFRHNDMHLDNVLRKKTQEKMYFVYRYSATMCLVVPVDGAIWVVADFGRSSGDIATQSIRPEALWMSSSDDSRLYLSHVQTKLTELTAQYPDAETVAQQQGDGIQALLNVMHNATKTYVESIDILRTASLFDDFRCAVNDTDIKKLLAEKFPGNDSARQVYVDIRPAEHSFIKPVASQIK